MRSRRAKVIPRTTRGWTKPKPSGLTFRAFRGRMWFAGVSGWTVKFSEPDPPARYWIGVDHGTIDYSAETTYTNTVGGVRIESIRRFLEAQSPSAQTTTLDGRPYVDAPKRTKLVGGLEKTDLFITERSAFTTGATYSASLDAFNDMRNRMKAGKS